MTIALHLELHVARLDAAAEAEARERAADAALLGIDEYVAESVAGAPFERIVAHLLMFDPRWLLARPWVRGWVATPECTCGGAGKVRADGHTLACPAGER